MKAEGCRGWREELGAYALDQLDAGYRGAVEAHLAGCGECRAELDLLTPVAAALPLADPGQLNRSAAPPRTLAIRIARGIAGEKRARRRRRVRIGGAIAATGAAAALALAIVLGGSSAPAPTGPGVKRVAFTSTPPGVEIGAELTPRAWGSEISLRVRGITPGTRCQVWLRRADGGRVAAGSFRYRYEGGSDAAALSSSLSPSDARVIGVRAGGRTFVAPVA
jgi:Putative zinc-finger